MAARGQIAGYRAGRRRCRRRRYGRVGDDRAGHRAVDRCGSEPESVVDGDVPDRPIGRARGIEHEWCRSRGPPLRWASRRSGAERPSSAEGSLPAASSQPQHETAQHGRRCAWRVRSASASRPAGVRMSWFETLTDPAARGLSRSRVGLLRSSFLAWVSGLGRRSSLARSGTGWGWRVRPARRAEHSSSDDGSATCPHRER